MMRLGLASPLLCLSLLATGACDSDDGAPSDTSAPETDGDGSDGDTNADDGAADNNDVDPRCEACFDSDGPMFTCGPGEVDCGTVYVSTGYSTSDVSELCGGGAVAAEDCPELESRNIEAMTCLFDFVAAGQTGTIRWQFDLLSQSDERRFTFRDDGTVFDLDSMFSDSGPNWSPQQLRTTPTEEIAACSEQPNSLAQFDCVALAIQRSQFVATCVDAGSVETFE